MTDLETELRATLSRVAHATRIPPAPTAGTTDGYRPAPDMSSIEIPVQFGSSPGRRTRPRALAVGASVAALAAAATAIVALWLPGSNDSGRSAALAPNAGAHAGPRLDPPVGLSDKALPEGKYSYRIVQQLQLDSDGKPVVGSQDAMIDRSYLNAAGDIVSFRTGSQQGCKRFPSDGANLEQPSVAFLAAMPTEVAALDEYLRSHVEGSSSQDEAVFVAVGDALRTADGLASPKLRAALLAVLSRTGGVLVHLGQHDYLGRPAIRADFVDQRIRPGEVHALYFDPANFRLLEEAFTSNGQPRTDAGPSPAYTAHAGPGVDPDQLPAAAFVAVMTHEQVVDSLPALPSSCP